MKNILLGLMLGIFFLPQISFADTQTPIVMSPALAAFVKQQDADAVVFFQQLTDEHSAFMKANPDIVAKLDQQGRDYLAAVYAHKKASMPTYDSTYASFMQKQESEKEAFLAKQAQDKRQFLSTQSS